RFVTEGPGDGGNGAKGGPGGPGGDGAYGAGGTIAISASHITGSHLYADVRGGGDAATTPSTGAGRLLYGSGLSQDTEPASFVTPTAIGGYQYPNSFVLNDPSTPTI